MTSFFKKRTINWLKYDRTVYLSPKDLEADHRNCPKSGKVRASYNPEAGFCPDQLTSEAGAHELAERRDEAGEIGAKAFEAG